MARYKHYDLNQTKMIPLSYADQIVEGSFEYALNEIVENSTCPCSSTATTTMRWGDRPQGHNGLAIVDDHSQIVGAMSATS